MLKPARPPPTRSAWRAALLFVALSLGTTAAQAALAVVDPNPPHVIRGTPYSAVMVTASGGTGPYSFVANSGLPTSMVLAANGTLSGTTCGGNGNYNVSVTVTDSTAATATGTVQVIVNSAAGACSLTIAPATLPAGTIGTAYSQTVTASGGTAPYTFVVSSGSLPAGLSLAANGAITGTPTTAGSITFSIRVTDSASKGGVLTYTVTIAAPIPLSLASSPAAATEVGVAYSQSNVASGGTTPYTYSISAGALPAGVTLNTGTGLVSGTPTSAGAFSYTVRVTDAVAVTATQPVSGTIAPVLALASAAAPAKEVGVAYSQTNAASGGTLPYAYAISGGALPAGLALNAATGLVSGTPTSAGAFSYTVRVTDAVAATATQIVSGTIASAVALAASPSAATQVGVAYSQSNVASGGTTPYAYTVSAGALPSGVTLNGASGLASGTPTSAGAFSYTIAVTDAAGSTASQASSGTIAAAAAPLSLVANAPGTTQVGVAYSQSNVASGGTTPYTYAISAGALPAGVTLNAGSGLVSGTPTSAGAFSYTVRVTDALSATATQTISGTVAAVGAPLALAATGPVVAQVGVAYSQTNVASGGTSPYTYSISAGALPAGVTLNGASGLVSGTPTSAGAFSYSVRVTDGVAATAAQTVSGTIASAVALASSPSAATQVGVAYSQANVASGGTTPYSYLVSAGALPAGLALNAGTGLVSGTPTTAGAFSYTIRASDSVAASATQVVSGTIAAAAGITVASGAPGTAEIGIAYSQANPASGGSGAFTYTLAGGALPAGLTLNAATGLVSGTPTVAGPFSYSVRATDNANPAASAVGTVVSGSVAPAVAITSSPAPLPALVGIAWSQSNSASGGTAPRAFSIAAGSLPAGISLNSTSGLVSGVPSAAGAFSYAIRVSDAAGGSAVGATISGTVGAAAVLTLGPATLGPFSIGALASQALVASGGTAPYAFAITSGTLPPGVAFDAASGVFSGTPTQAGNHSFTVRATDAQGASTTLVVSLVVKAATIHITGTLVAYLNVATTQTLRASGGVAPYVFALRSGALPDGLTLQPDGSISGTPTRAGVFAFVVTVTDSDPTGANHADQAYSIRIGERADPSRNAEVLTLLGQQVAAARRVATAQITNVRGRLRDLRSDAPPPCTAGDATPPPAANAANRESMSEPSRGPGATPRPLNETNLPIASCRRTDAMTGWTAGSLEVGSTDASAGARDFGFHTHGVSLGIDRAAQADVDVGIGLGLARERADAAGSGTSNATSAVSAMAYLSWRPSTHAFVDAIVGHAEMRMRSMRRLDDGSRLGGERSGAATFASLATGFTLGRRESELTPYARLEAIRATLRGFAEDPNSTESLKFERQTVPSLKIALGFEAAARQPTAWGELTPRMRLELRHEFERSSQATLRYADDPAGPSYVVDSIGSSRNSVSAGLGATLALRNRWSIGASYDVDYSGNTRSDRFELKLSRPFH